MRNHRLYLKRIFEAMDDIRAFIEGMDCEAFAADDKTASAAVLKNQLPSLQPIIKQILKNMEKEQHDGC